MKAYGRRSNLEVDASGVCDRFTRRRTDSQQKDKASSPLQEGWLKKLP